MQEKEDFSYYTYNVGKDGDYYDKPRELVWNVIVENNNKIEVYNILSHRALVNKIKESREQYKIFREFAESIRSTLMYLTWSKCEWEIIVTSWPTFVENKELDRMIKEREEHKEKWGKSTVRSGVNLSVEKKVDVFTQVMLNWDAFIDYVWINRNDFK